MFTSSVYIKYRKPYVDICYGSIHHPGKLVQYTLMWKFKCEPGSGFWIILVRSRQNTVAQHPAAWCVVMAAVAAEGREERGERRDM